MYAKCNINLIGLYAKCNEIFSIMKKKCHKITRYIRVELNSKNRVKY